MSDRFCEKVDNMAKELLLILEEIDENSQATSGAMDKNSQATSGAMDENSQATGGEMDENSQATGGVLDENSQATGGALDENSQASSGEMDENSQATGGEMDENSQATGGEMDENSQATGGEMDENSQATGGAAVDSKYVEDLIDNMINITKDLAQLSDDIQRGTFKKVRPRLIALQEGEDTTYAEFMGDPKILEYMFSLPSEPVLEIIEENDSYIYGRFRIESDLTEEQTEALKDAAEKKAK